MDSLCDLWKLQLALVILAQTRCACQFVSCAACTEPGPAPKASSYQTHESADVSIVTTLLTISCGLKLTAKQQRCIRTIAAPFPAILANDLQLLDLGIQSIGIDPLSVLSPTVLHDRLCAPPPYPAACLQLWDIAGGNGQESEQESEQEDGQAETDALTAARLKLRLQQQQEEQEERQELLARRQEERQERLAKRRRAGEQASPKGGVPAAEPDR